MKIMKKFGLFLCLIVIVMACNHKKSDEINLRLDWIPSMSFAGDIIGMNKYANENGIIIRINPAGEAIDPIKMVLSGSDNIGIVGLDKMIMANEKGANLVAFAIIDNVTPTVFMAKTSTGIKTPYDFIGKKVGVQSGGATEFVYRSLVYKLGIDTKKYEEVQIGFDMRPFVADQYDVRPGFIFDEAVFLDINNVDYNLIEPKDYGLNYPGRVYFCERKYLDENPEQIQNFVNTVALGWEYALANPDTAIVMLQKFAPEIDYQRELTGLKKAKSYFSGYNNKILMPDTTAIQQMVENLFALGILKEKPKFSEYFVLDFVNKYHDKKE
jgi:NitT/TauT family transport system substrate-binding protein